MAFNNILPVKTENTIGYYEDIVKNKKSNHILYGKKNRLGKIEYSDLYSKVKNSYTQYDNNLITLENLKKIKILEYEQQELENCYTNKTKGLKLLKEQIKKNQKGYYKTFCAYCDMVQISTFDHFVPKSKFPEFSVHPLNLIPSCSICNEKKGELFLDEENQRVFFNPYFDKPDDDIYRMDLKYDAISNTLYFKMETINKKYSFTIQKLNLTNRYEEYAQTILPEYLEDIILTLKDDSSSYEENWNLIEKNYKRHMNAKRKSRGKHSVEYLLFKGLYYSKFFNKDFFIKNFL